MDKTYIKLYEPFIEREKRISKSLIRPRNIYRISSYLNVEGEIQSLAGIKSSLFFATGIYEKKLHGIKINELKPEYFFDWVSKLVDYDKRNDEAIDKMEEFEDIVIMTDRGGQRIYESFVKASPILKRFGTPFRTYNLDGLKYISKVYFKKDVLKSKII